jgi:uncharacterized protein YkwD
VERGGRTLFALIVLGSASLGFSPGASSSGRAENRALRPAEQGLVEAINHARGARGIPTLRMSPRLRRAARAHSHAMANTGSFVHGDWYRRLRRHGIRARVLGETIAWGAGANGTPAAIVAMWLASPPHRATLLSRQFRRVGVGVAVGSMGGVPGASIATANFAG